MSFPYPDINHDCVLHLIDSIRFTQKNFCKVMFCIRESFSLYLTTLLSCFPPISLRQGDICSSEKRFKKRKRWCLYQLSCNRSHKLSRKGHRNRQVLYSPAVCLSAFEYLSIHIGLCPRPLAVWIRLYLLARVREHEINSLKWEPFIMILKLSQPSDIKPQSNRQAQSYDWQNLTSPSNNVLGLIGT